MGEHSFLESNPNGESRHALADDVNARLLGPSRLRYVLRVAEEAGLLRRSGRDRWTAA